MKSCGILLLAILVCGVRAQEGAEQLDTAAAAPDTVVKAAVPAAPVAAPISSPESLSPSSGTDTTAVWLPPTVVVAIDTQKSRSAGRSAWLAAGLSCVLPGAGEAYLGSYGRAKFFFTTELFYVAATYLSWRSRENALQSAREIANRYAGAEASGKSAAFLELMSEYRSRRLTSPSRHDSYNEAMILSGYSTTREFADDDSHNWDWGSSENSDNSTHLRAFESQLRTYRASRLALNFSIGAMIVSRALSLADVLWIRRTTWVAEVTPTYEGASLRLARSF